MTDKLFDEFVKSKLENHNSGVPMHVWERMKKEKGDRKGFFFFLNRYVLFAALLLLSTGVGYLVIQSNTKSAAATKPSKKINNKESKENQNLNFTNTQDSKTSQSINKNTIATNEDKTEALSNDIVSNNNQQTANANYPSNNSAPTKIKQQLNKTASVNTLAENLFSDTSSKNKIAVPYNTNQKKNDLSNGTTDNAVVINTKQSPASIQFTGYQSKKSALSTFKIGNVAQTLNRPSCPTISGPRRRDLFLEVYLSPDYNVRNFTAASAPGNYLTERQNNETYRTSFSTGVRLVKNLGEKTLFKGGINYSQINERLQIVSENAKQTTQIITIRSVVRAPGDTLFIRDTMYYEQTGTKYRTTYNRYRFIDLPLIFSYEFGNPELMHFSVNAGPIFNITSFYSGEVLDTTFKPMRITTATGNGANNWRSNIGLGFYAGLSVYKKLNDRIHLFGEPYIRYNFNPVTQSSTVVKQRYVITGMQLGIRYNLLKQGQRYR